MFRMFITTCAAALALGGAAMSEPVDITRSITDIAAGADRGEWSRVRAAFADTVTTDYTSLFGGTPATQAADDLVAAWAGFLPGFDATHHMVTNHTIAQTGPDQATAQADFTATHRIGDALWILGGRYEYALELTETRWVVSGLTMQALWEQGDRGLVQQAAERATARQ